VRTTGLESRARGRRKRNQRALGARAARVATQHQKAIQRAARFTTLAASRVPTVCIAIPDRTQPSLGL